MMKLDRFLSLSVIIGLSAISPTLLHAGNPPAATFQPGPWQPVARVDMTRPVQIKIINKTNLDLNYDLSANINSSPQRIAPGENTTLQGFVIPAYILINRAEAASNPDSRSLLYGVEVNGDNLVTVTVTRAERGQPGYTTFNLNREGAIYIY